MLSCFRAGLAAITLCATVATVAHANEPDGPELPTQLINTPDIGDLNGPCSLCRVDKIKTIGESTNSSATLDLYYDDDSGAFSGYIELSVLLTNGDFHYVTIEDVSLPEQEITVLDLAPGVDFSWIDVAHVWVEPLRQ